MLRPKMMYVSFLMLTNQSISGRSYHFMCCCYQAGKTALDLANHEDIGAVLNHHIQASFAGVLLCR